MRDETGVFRRHPFSFFQREIVLERRGKGISCRSRGIFDEEKVFLHEEKVFPPEENVFSVEENLFPHARKVFLVVPEVLLTGKRYFPAKKTFFPTWKTFRLPFQSSIGQYEIETLEKGERVLWLCRLMCGMALPFRIGHPKGLRASARHIRSGQSPSRDLWGAWRKGRAIPHIRRQSRVCTNPPWSDFGESKNCETSHGLFIWREVRRRFRMTF